MRSLVLALLALLGASAAQAQSVESFYRGRTINLVIGYSVGPDDDSPIRHRVRSACDRFVACESWPDAAVAEAIARDQIDILVDLSGHTSGARTAILARRPAPIQVNLRESYWVLLEPISGSIAMPREKMPMVVPSLGAAL